ncbi:MAG TPA: FAD-binding oxidoreductase [Candidatus Methylomirabilis sp.]|nr:FAD-binding oxidoreductase [Candidatus Methylomirabilis sp.]
MDTAAAVVVGSGALGASTAYHLARRGADVVLVDQHALGSQTSPRAAGLTSKADATPVMARLRHESCLAFEGFEAEMGRSVDFHRSGSLKAAYTPGGEARLRAGLETAHGLGIEARLIAAAEARKLAPHFEPGAARAIGHVPSDGWLEPAKVASAFAARAAELGARTLPFTRVEKLLEAGGRVLGVATGRGEIHSPVVVDAAGAWTTRVAGDRGISLPLVPVRHQLFITEPIAGVEPLQPIVRLLEASVYVRYAQGGLMFGGYEDHPQVIDTRRWAASFQIAELPLDLGVLRSLVDEVADHFPVLRSAPVAVHRGGAPTMTPDGRPILGAVPGLEGFYVASGCCVGGLSLSPAAGRALADLILDGKSDPDLSPLSVERFRGRHGAAADLEAVCVEQYARKYTH